MKKKEELLGANGEQYDFKHCIWVSRWQEMKLWWLILIVHGLRRSQDIRKAIWYIWEVFPILTGAEGRDPPWASMTSSHRLEEKAERQPARDLFSVFCPRWYWDRKCPPSRKKADTNTKASAQSHLNKRWSAFPFHLPSLPWATMALVSSLLAIKTHIFLPSCPSRTILLASNPGVP